MSQADSTHTTSRTLEWYATRFLITAFLIGLLKTATDLTFPSQTNLLLFTLTEVASLASPAFLLAAIFAHLTWTKRRFIDKTEPKAKLPSIWHLILAIEFAVLASLLILLTAPLTTNTTPSDRIPPVTQNTITQEPPEEHMTTSDLRQQLPDVPDDSATLNENVTLSRSDCSLTAVSVQNRLLELPYINDDYICYYTNGETGCAKEVRFSDNLNACVLILSSLTRWNADMFPMYIELGTARTIAKLVQGEKKELVDTILWAQEDSTRQTACDLLPRSEVRDSVVLNEYCSTLRSE